MVMQPKDPNKPVGSGSVTKATIFVDGNSKTLHRVDGEILQKFEGVEIKRSKPKELVVLKIQKQPMKIFDIIDRSEGFRITREIVMRPLSKDELKGNTSNVTF